MLEKTGNKNFLSAFVGNNAYKGENTTSTDKTNEQTRELVTHKPWEEMRTPTKANTLEKPICPNIKPRCTHGIRDDNRFSTL
ncbi:hypothetical protein PanWU01x14_108480 [Parasponia andersonii]|uniref:Uncharacterized protein n=1 Tax=Parasponia andersonii TaxID=3476 RepID=A0A2P5CZY1_PARAD|nr:hypothetical protein PanWU01x14_108480 [Parasponia andersonii]